MSTQETPPVERIAQRKQTVVVAVCVLVVLRLRK